VVGFEEKPSLKRAAQLMAEGALWNCGVFCFRLGYLEQVLAAKGYPTDYAELVRNFAQLPKRSFDYEVVEQTTSVAVSPYHGMWEDLGTWGALSGKMDDTLVGLGETVSCENTHVVNELGIPVVTMGLQDIMVVATPDGILVADKESAAGLKDIIARYDTRPMCEERLWGSYRVLDYQKLEDGTEVLTKWIELYPGHHLSYQKHAWRSEVWTIVSGEGEMAVDGRLVKVAAGDVMRVYAEQWHAIRAQTPIKLVEVQRGSVLTEEDITRRYMTWAEIEQHCTVCVRQ
jgi:mannose-1-phosphate guanylyltransferase